MAFAPGEFGKIAMRLWGGDALNVLSEELGINVRTLQRWRSGAAPVPAEIESRIRQQAESVSDNMIIDRVAAVCTVVRSKGAWESTLRAQLEKGWLFYQASYNQSEIVDEAMHRLVEDGED